MFGSIYNYITCKIERPYYNEVISLLFNITNACYLWVNCCLLLSLILKDTTFSGGIQLIVLGIPVIGMIEFFCPHPKNQIILKRASSLKTANEAERYIRYLTQVIHNRQEKNNRIFFNIFLEILLEAYVKEHVSTCRVETCSLTIYFRELYQNADGSSCNVSCKSY